MDILTGLAIFLILWGAACIYVALGKPKWVWNTGKLRGFVELIGEKGTTIFLIVVGAIAILGGILIYL